MKRSAPVPESGEGYRQMLLEKRTAVMSGLGIKFDTLARMGRVAEEDQAQLSHDEFVSLHLNSLDYAQLKLVQEAIDRLDAGDYGVCLACDQPIPPKRLRVLSWARYCVKCQDSAGIEMDREMGMERTRVPVGVR